MLYNKTLLANTGTNTVTGGARGTTTNGSDSNGDGANGLAVVAQNTVFI
jgi:hypothetical protein